jgi:hypothetical protein
MRLSEWVGRRRFGQAPTDELREGDFNKQAAQEKSRIETFEKCPYFVIPAKAGIQKILKRLDSRLRGNDSLDHMRRNSIKVSDCAAVCGKVLTFVQTAA